MKRLLICGATGFIGRNLVNYYSQLPDYQVFGTYNNTIPYEASGVEFIKVDLRNKEEVDLVIKDKDIIIQAAATTSGAKDIVNKPYYHVTDNAIMNSLILKSIFASCCEHLIFLSCTTMYQHSDIMQSENDFDANKNMIEKYFGVGWTKIYIEKMCEFYSKISDTKFTVIRHSNIYGPHDKYDLERSHFFGATITKVMKAQNGSELTVWGQGTEKRDLLYISDLVDFINIAIEKQKTKYEIFNVGLGITHSVNEIVGKIINSASKQLIIKHDLNQPNIDVNIGIDIRKADRLLNWKPKISVDVGIEKTIEWYKQNELLK
jgi:GDP-L-fucose synthase